VQTRAGIQPDHEAVRVEIGLQVMRCGLTAVLLLCALSARATYQTGNSLLDDCGGAPGLETACLAYITGVVDALEMSWRQSKTTAQFCIPDGVRTLR